MPIHDADVFSISSSLVEPVGIKTEWRPRGTIPLLPEENKVLRWRRNWDGLGMMAVHSAIKPLRFDGFVKSPSAALPFTFVAAAYQPSTPHTSGFARLASGAFYAAIALRLFARSSGLRPRKKPNWNGRQERYANFPFISIECLH